MAFHLVYKISLYPPLVCKFQCVGLPEFTHVFLQLFDLGQQPSRVVRVFFKPVQILDGTNHVLRGLVGLGLDFDKRDANRTRRENQRDQAF
jgi:hypothetical protein